MYRYIVNQGGKDSCVIVLATQTLCIHELLFKEKLGAKSVVFSVLLWFSPEVNLLFKDCWLHSCAAVTLSETLQLGLGKADVFQSKLGLFSEVSLPVFNVHNSIGIYLPPKTAVKMDKEKGLFWFCSLQKADTRGQKRYSWDVLSFMYLQLDCFPSGLGWDLFLQSATCSLLKGDFFFSPYWLFIKSFYLSPAP